MVYSEPIEDSNGVWVINVYFDSGDLKGSLEFETEEIAKRERDKLIDAEGGEEPEQSPKEEKKGLEKKSDFLKNITNLSDLDDNSQAIIPQDDVFGGETQEELEKKLEDHKSEFEKEEKKCAVEAKSLLLQVA